MTWGLGFKLQVLGCVEEGLPDLFHSLISEKVFSKSFFESQFTLKFINCLTISSYKMKLTGLWVNRLYRNDFQQTVSEMNSRLNFIREENLSEHVLNLCPFRIARPNCVVIFVENHYTIRSC